MTPGYQDSQGTVIMSSYHPTIGYHVKLRRGVAVLALMLALSGCGSSSEMMSGPMAPSRTVRPGETLPLGDAVRLSISGDYLLPAGARRITIRCTGAVTVSFMTPSSLQANTCQSADGTATQTNIVEGATQVTFDIDTGAFADVTVT